MPKLGTTSSREATVPQNLVNAPMAKGIPKLPSLHITQIQRMAVGPLMPPKALPVREVIGVTPARLPTSKKMSLGTF